MLMIPTEPRPRKLRRWRRGLVLTGFSLALWLAAGLLAWHLARQSDHADLTWLWLAQVLPLFYLALVGLHVVLARRLDRDDASMPPQHGD